ncbi:SH3 domain-containing protein [Umezawaea tangerina]|uniref:SH3 domain-containing protein n=1 Tax=Umezawaea tangerina TaxID=84725 RepID=A0A2T0T4S3_9PSEU|nr:SH3 domain-containing protein [Umezawaea tangerina]PRY40670.1 hypothetical protein CLV43_106411 [Umezawaea tangerina]
MELVSRSITALSVAAALLMSGAATALAAPPGEAAVSVQAGCPDNTWSNQDNRTGKLVLTAANIRTGPSTTCTSVGQAQTSHSVTLHCWKPGQDGTWSHARDNSTGKQGWIKDTLLAGNGAMIAC